MREGRVGHDGVHAHRPAFSPAAPGEPGRAGNLLPGGGPAGKPAAVLRYGVKRRDAPGRPDNSNRGTLFLAVRGLPWVVLVVLGILVVYTTLLGRTRFGRYIYAIGGNAEAARRAGVNTNRIRVIAFALCGVTAGITGIIYSSYLGSISSGVNGGANVLNAVAAAVIGGTSLFGGRGKMLDALLGGLVVGVIANGLQLLGLSAPAQLMWTAVVLIAAVTVDALTRRGRTTTI